MFKKSNDDVQELRDSIPEELYGYFDTVVSDLYKQVSTTVGKVEKQLDYILQGIANDQLGFEKLQQHFDSPDGKLWYDGTLLTRREETLLYKAYREGIELFKLSWIQIKKTKHPNRSRQFLCSFITL